MIFSFTGVHPRSARQVAVSKLYKQFLPINEKRGAGKDETNRDRHCTVRLVEDVHDSRLLFHVSSALGEQRDNLLI